MSDHEAKEARRLLDDRFLGGVLEDVRDEALEDLAVAKMDDILRLQALVAAVDAIRSVLEAMTHRQTQPDDKASPFA